MAATTLAIIGALSAGAQVYEGRRQARKAEQVGRRQERSAAETEASLAQRESLSEGERQRDIQRQRQKLRASSVSGRQSTVLTGSLGLVGEPATAGRTLLGL